MLLAIVPRGAAPLAGVAGLCAAGLVACDRPGGLAALRWPAAILGMLVLWGAASALWALDPGHSLTKPGRVAGLFVAGLALAAAASRIAVPGRTAWLILAGAGVAIAVALCDLATAGAISGLVSVRPFAPPRLNQIAVWLAILVLPGGALLLCRGRLAVAASIVAAMAGTVLLLDGTAAKIALGLGLPVAALLCWRRRAAARIAAAAMAIAILIAPVTLPRLHDIPGVLAAADAFKLSAGHRLLIWSFAGERIAERPLSGWGIDSARALPGAKEQIRPYQSQLPLHPHNAPLQVWLELGVPGAVLFAGFVAFVWLRLAEARWPDLYAAAAGGGLAAITVVAFAGWGIWQEWWLATLAFAAFAMIVMGRAAGNGNRGSDAVRYEARRQ